MTGFRVGDTCGTRVRERLEIIAHKKYSGEKGYLSGYHTNDSPEFWVKLDNYDLQIRVFPNQVKSSEEGAIARPKTATAQGMLV